MMEVGYDFFSLPTFHFSHLVHPRASKKFLISDVLKRHGYAVTLA